MTPQFVFRALFLALAALSLSFENLCAQNQENRYDATIITLQGDTIEGAVRPFISSTSSFHTLVYWDQEGVKHKVKPESLQGFESQGKVFESVKLNDSSCPTCYKQVLLCRLIDGPMILYRYYTHASRPHLIHGVKTKCIQFFYIRKAGDDMAIRAYKKNCENSPLQILAQPNNNLQFVEYFSDVRSIYVGLKSKELGRSDIMKLVSKYNKAILERPS
ncbi:MAG: hypothetical protein ABFS10_05775 [Bacteroidota bacterium]